MKTNINTMIFRILMVLMLLVTSVNFAQNYADENEAKKQQELLEQNQTTLFGFSSSNDDAKLSSLQGNSVFLKQVGEYNAVKVVSKTNKSEINLSQNGFANKIRLDYYANAVLTDVAQNGDYNMVKDYVYGENENASLNLNQDGDNLYFERFGSNELTKSLKFNQTEASPLIIVRSFK